MEIQTSIKLTRSAEQTNSEMMWGFDLNDRLKAKMEQVAIDEINLIGDKEQHFQFGEYSIFHRGLFLFFVGHYTFSDEVCYVTFYFYHYDEISDFLGLDYSSAQYWVMREMGASPGLLISEDLFEANIPKILSLILVEELRYVHIQETPEIELSILWQDAIEELNL